ncbi:aldehyde dehydrogenase family protein [Dactylosporangium sp. NPDC005572]|uniref:aldehyde dehydrogenase family protein n=1 Tax=Dactylosporangium sp. NPDC005572 TaxID=3156889 RepID=UPI0033BEEB0F
MDHPIYVAGEWQTSGDPLPVTNPADGSLVGRTFNASPEQYERAVTAAQAVAGQQAKQPAYERGRQLRAIAERILARKDEIGALIALEAGKPVRDAVVEAERGAFTFRLAAEEAERSYGEVIPLDLNEVSRGRTGITRRFPIGPVAGISPFNLPLGLAAHKVAPALATGCPIVLKPPSAAPLTMLLVAQIIDEVGALPGSVSVLPMSRALGDRLVEDPRFNLLTFTGSPAVGWSMKARAGRKKVVLELGGNAGAIVDTTADLDHAAARCAYGAFKYAGQICISVQRIFVLEDVWEPFLERFLARTDALVVGDPSDAGVDLGPLIDDGAAARTQGWVDEAVAAGATLLRGGKGEGRYFAPTVLTDVPHDANICREEAFAPVVVLERVAGFDAALAAVNDSAFGLQAGVFTNDLRHSWQAFNELHVGGVVLNDAPTYRIDHMPYGGVKDSGLGREGLRWAMEDMTEIRIFVVPDRV